MRIMLACFSLLAFSAAAHAQSADCIEITSLPYTASEPGVHCMKRSLTGVGGVSITADNVTVELNGHTLESDAHGVSSTADVRNSTVRNGTIRAGSLAVSLSSPGTSGNLVELIRADRSGIRVGGSGSAVRNNIVISPLPAGRSAIVYGIEVHEGTGIRVSHNQVINPGEGLPHEVGGYRLVHTAGAVVEHNLVSSAALPQGPAFGINISASGGTVVAGNRVANMKFGILNSGPGAVVFVENTAFGATLGAYVGGTMVGTTNVSFQ